MPAITMDAPTLAQHGRQALRAGLAALAVVGLCVLFAPRAALFAYLSAFLLWSGIPLGCAAILMLHHLGGGRWGLPIRPTMEAATITIPVLLLLFVPVALGLSQLYPWVHGSHHDHLLERKQAYLNVPFFLTRAAAFLALWSAGAWLLFQRSTRHSDTQPAFSPRLAAPGLVIYVLTFSFAAIDWIGTLEPHWYSSIFGLYLLIGQALSAMTVLILLAATESTASEPAATGRIDALHDLGTLLLTLVILHAYVAYSQFFIIWNGNLPHEIGWYVPRSRGLWGWVAVLLILVHFGLPFALLLSRAVKRRPAWLVRVAIVIVVARCIESMWVVLPSYDGPVLGVLPLAILSFVGVGGVWLAVFAAGWRRRMGEPAAAAGGSAA